MVITQRQALSAAAVVVGVAVSTWIFTRSPKLGPEKQIQALIDGAIGDAEDGDVGDLMDRVGASYKGEGGDRAELRSYLTGALLGGGIDVRVVTQRIDLVEPTAAIQMDVILSRGGIRGATQGDVGVRTIHIDLAREDDEWKVIGAQVD